VGEWSANGSGGPITLSREGSFLGCATNVCQEGERCCGEDEGRSLGAAFQKEASNRPLLLPSREVVVRELGKGRARSGQVRTVESNASEPPMTCRKRRNGVETGRESLSRDQSGGNLSTAQAASGMKAARTRSRLLCGTWEPVTPMPREKRKGKPPKCASTDAG